MVVVAPGAIVVVVLVGVVVLVVVLVVLVVDLVGDVVVDVAGGGGIVVVGAGAGDGAKMFLTVVPTLLFPKIAASGFPEISSIAVMNISAITNTMAAVPAMVVHRNRRGLPDRPGGRAGCIGRVVASMRSVAGASATAEISRCWVSWAGAADDAISAVSAPAPGDVDPVGPGDTSAGEPPAPPVPVPPSLRSNGDDPGARTTTCLTASWPRSMDCATNAVAKVAAAEPMATPTMVPLTPKLDAMIAAMTAPAAEARI